jgi:cyclopropane-fatty-acyl-phospholipid synthase
MFEHMRNYRELLSRISSWLKPGGKLFVHIFCHRNAAYPYLDSGDPNDWMTRHFFAGGMMPSDDLLSHFQEDLHLEKQWRWDGTHYEKTSNAWLANMDQSRERCMPIFEATYGEQATLWWGRWRLFFMACAEFFGLCNGEEWWVSHYRFEKPNSDSVAQR